LLALSLLPLPLTMLLCASAGPGSCSGVPAGMAMALVLPPALGILLGTLWRAWRTLRMTDLRGRSGWTGPPLHLKWGYASALLLQALLVAGVLTRVGALHASPVPARAVLFEAVLLLAVPMTLTVFSLLRLLVLVTAPGAMRLPAAVIRRTTAAMWVLLGAVLLSLVQQRLGWEGPLALALPLVKLLALAGVELPRFAVFERETQPLDTNAEADNWASTQPSGS
jgi:hypothetical protein